MHKLYFEVVEDGMIYLHINELVIIPFKNIDDWRTFANQMLDMIPEIKENL
jgi:hypothetical protein